MNYPRHIAIIMLAILATGVTCAQFGGPTATIIGSDSKVCVGDSVAAYISCSGDDPFDLVINDSHGKYLEMKDVGFQVTIWLKPEQDEVYYIKEVRDRHGRKGKTFGEVAVSVYETTPVSILLERTTYLQSEPGVLLEAMPSGGVFSGNGVVGSTFYPGIATPVGSPHEITYSYNNSNGCVSTDQVLIYVLWGEAEVYLIAGSDTVVTLCDNGETYVIIGTNKDNAAGSFELREAASGDPVEGPVIDEDPKDNEALLDPSGLSGLYDIFYTYTRRGITVQTSYRFMVVSLGELTLPDLPAEVCQGHAPYPLVPDLIADDPDGIYTITGPGVVGNQEEGYYFDPADPGVEVGDNEIQVEYTSSNGCFASAAITVTVLSSPVVAFAFDPACISSGGGSVAFENLTSGKEEVESWGWEFGDPSSGADNFSEQENPTHFYSEPGPRTISLAALTTSGCLVRSTMDTILYDVPTAGFSWMHDCIVEGEMTKFLNQSYSEFSPLDTFVWTFMTSGGMTLGEAISESTEDTIGFDFNGSGNYRVKLHVGSEAGCQAEVIKELDLKPTVILSPAPYEEKFNEPEQGWTPGTENGNMSWIRDQPDFEGYVQVQGDKAWFTSLPVDQVGYIEYSWVESPCFDFRGITHPVLKLDLMKSFFPVRDGAVLQFRENNSEEWATLGAVGEGVNWYNLEGITLVPGGSTFGWGLEDFEPDDGWVRATHDLGMLTGMDHVKLRIAIGSGSSQAATGNQGFAFDNLFIGEPFRRSLIEHFTNSSSEVCIGADSIVDVLASANPERVIDLQYHLDFPGVDIMNLNNPYPPSTRAFNYGVQGVPLAILNGGAGEEYRFDFTEPGEVPDEEVIQEASLEDPLFDLDMDVNWMANSLEATTLVTCRTNDFDANLQLYVAVIETSVTSYPGLNGDSVFRNVVLDIIPSPTGLLLGNNWYAGKSDLQTFSWIYKEYVEDTEDLALVAFVQNRDNREVLQVATGYRTPVVGQGESMKDESSMRIYPNPATGWLFVQLRPLQEKKGLLKVLDMTGKVVYTQATMPGSGQYRMDVSGIPPGVYVVCRVVNGMVVDRNMFLITR